MEKIIDLSIVIPAYNEGKRIGRSLEKIFSYLSGKNFLAEVIVVDDGSSDDTLSILSNFKDPRLTIITNKVNMGKGFSVKRGIEEAKGRFIIFSDADLSTPVEEADKFLLFLSNQCDLAIGSRYITGADVKLKQPWYRQLMARMFNFFVQLIAIPGIRDSQCGFKGFKKECASAVFNYVDTCGYSFDVEVIYVAYKMGFKIKEIPVTWYDSPSSRINPLTDPLKMFFDVLKIRWKHRNGVYV